MPQQRAGAALRALGGAAALVVVIAGLEAAGDILLPILLAVFLSIVANPLVKALRRLGLPSVIAIPVVVLFLALGLLGITALVANSLRSFSAQIAQYEEPLDLLRVHAFEYLAQLGVQTPEEQVVNDLLSPAMIMPLVSQTLTALVGVLSRMLIVVVTVTFILFEAAELEVKVRTAFGTETRPAGPFDHAVTDMQRYLLIKTLVSAATGLLAFGLCLGLGLDFPVLWGVLAFLLNYVPSVGSIVAAVPPLLLALVQLGAGSALGVLGGYLAINVALGNFLEPRLMGRSLGLSPLVVFLSLIFWGWVWGPVGMLFSVPMTVLAKILLESYEESRWIAIFLGSSREVREEERRAAAPVEGAGDKASPGQTEERERVAGAGT